MNIYELEAEAGQAAQLLKAMSNERRLMVLCHLIDCERSAGELERLVGLGQSALSQHLAKLRSQGLVRTRREGQSIFYALAGNGPREVMEVLHRLYCDPGPRARRGKRM